MLIQVLALQKVQTRKPGLFLLCLLGNVLDEAGGVEHSSCDATTSEHKHRGGVIESPAHNALAGLSAACHCSVAIHMATRGLRERRCAARGKAFKWACVCLHSGLSHFLALWP